MKNRKSPFFVLTLLTMLFCVALAAFGQVLDTNTPPGTNAPPGGVIDSPTDVFNSFALILIPVLTPILIRLGALVLPKVPTWALPVLAPLVGLGVDAVSGLLGGPNVSLLWAAVLGSAGTGLREIKDQVIRRMKASTPAVGLFLVCPMLMIGLTGCKTTQIDPVTGLPVKKYDPVKTEKVKAALEPIGSGAIRRIIANNPTRRVELGNYFRAVGGVFCSMQAGSNFTPSYLITAMDQATASHQGQVDQFAIDIKDALVAVYKIAWADRGNAELSPEKWPVHVAGLVCDATDQGLKDSGLPGTKP